MVGSRTKCGVKIGFSRRNHLWMFQEPFTRQLVSVLSGFQRGNILDWDEILRGRPVLFVVMCRGLCKCVVPVLSGHSTPRKAAISLGMVCVSDMECRLSDLNSRCVNGVCDCAVKTNGSASCGATNRGCHPGTFQVRPI